MTQSYEQLFTIKKEKYAEKAYLVKKVVEQDAEACFAHLINPNLSYFNYLVTHFAAPKRDEQLLEITKKKDLKAAFFTALAEDSLFNDLMLAYDNEPKSSLSDSLSMDELLNIAVKFFSIMTITPDGNFVTTACTGTKGFQDTESVRRPHVEAFCFAAIIGDIQQFDGTAPNMRFELSDAVAELYTINWGEDRTEKLLRAQGALYMLMRRSEYLQHLLKKSYQEKKAFLPFQLILE